VLIQAGRSGERLQIADVCDQLQTSEPELREDISVLNVVNFGGGAYVLYADVSDDGTIEVDPEPYADTFDRPARLLPIEAKALVAAIDLLGEHLPEGSLSSARTKIVAALGEDPVREGLQITSAEGDDPILARVIAGAIADRRVLELEYYAANEDQFSERRIEPYGLINSAQGWYVAAWDPSREDTRHFRLDRIKRATVLEETYEPRPDLGPGGRHRGLAANGRGAGVTARARVDRAGAGPLGPGGPHGGRRAPRRRRRRRMGVQGSRLPRPRGAARGGRRGGARAGGRPRCRARRRRADARRPGRPRGRLTARLGSAAMNTLKGLILSGGKGTRLRPITHTSAKQLVPVANKPVLFYGIEAMAAAGIEEIGIIIAPETGSEIRDAAGDGSRFGVAITYIEQDAPLGLAHAVLTAEPFLGSDAFVMYLGDNLLQGGIADLVAAFRANEPPALILLTPVPDPENYGVAELHASGGVKQLVEKPAEPRTDLALVGVYMFTSRIHEAARAIEPSRRGELEITDAIQWIVDQGEPVESHIVQGWWKDTGRLDDMLEANRLILETIERRVDGDLADSQIDGRVIVEAGATLERCTVRGPAIIGAGARLTDAYVGPYTAIGEHVVIETAEVEHSILLEGSSVRGLAGRMESSLLGRNVTVHRSRRQPRAYTFMVGDQSEIEIL
jgi:glucose-1-phosphate thymidylyltransferase